MFSKKLQGDVYLTRNILDQSGAWAIMREEEWKIQEFVERKGSRLAA